MTADIRGRFITITDAYPKPVVFLSDIGYWSEHEQELDRWCAANRAQRQGMTVTMDQDVLTLFSLRWS